MDRRFPSRRRSTTWRRCTCPCPPRAPLTCARHEVGATKGVGGSVEKALGSIKVPLLYMPSETDLYFPLTDARYEARFIPHVTLTPIPSLWGHPAGAGIDPEDRKLLNEKIAAFLAAPALAH